MDAAMGSTSSLMRSPARPTCRILGCHVVGERAVEITQVAAIAMAAGMPVDDLAQVPLSCPTYTDILALVAASAARQLNLQVNWQAHQPDSTWHAARRA
jgi:dihydrolipoamide dehydrogenase